MSEILSCLTIIYEPMNCEKVLSTNASKIIRAFFNYLYFVYEISGT